MPDVPVVANDAPVCSYNEWDPLEEVIVGRVTGAMLPTRHVAERVWGNSALGALIGRASAGKLSVARYWLILSTQCC